MAMSENTKKLCNFVKLRPAFAPQKELHEDIFVNCEKYLILYMETTQSILGRIPSRIGPRLIYSKS